MKFWIAHALLEHGYIQGAGGALGESIILLPFRSRKTIKMREWVGMLADCFTVGIKDQLQP